MATLLINVLLMGWIVLFGAMAILPVLLDRPKAAARKPQGGEDRVLRIDHKAVLTRRTGVSEPVLVPMPPVHDHPTHRPAA